MSSGAGFGGRDAKRHKMSSEAKEETEESDDEENIPMLKVCHYEEKVLSVSASVTPRSLVKTGHVEQASPSWYTTYRARVGSAFGDASRQFGSSEYDVHILEKRGEMLKLIILALVVHQYKNANKMTCVQFNSGR